MVYESFLSLSPLVFLVLVFWIIRFVIGVDINSAVQTAFAPLVFALNTLPGILAYAFVVTMLWSVGINGDNAMDAIVARSFFNIWARTLRRLHTVSRFHTSPRTGSSARSLMWAGQEQQSAWRSFCGTQRSPGSERSADYHYRPKSFKSTNRFFFGIPIVLNPIFMIPYILNALILTTCSYLLMYWNVIQRPFVNLPWTTPPIIGHYLITGGDWRAAVWGVISILIAMSVYYPFAKVAERQRLAAEAAGMASE